MGSEDFDEMTQNDINPRGEKSGAEDEAGDLDLECHGAVDALRGPGAGDPAEELAEPAENEEELPPAAGEDGEGEVGGCEGAEEDDEGDAGGEGGGVAVVGRVGWVEGGTV